MSNISTVVKSIQDIMRQDAGVDGDAQRISQLVWMIFLKIFSDKEEEWSITKDDYVGINYLTFETRIIRYIQAFGFSICGY